MATSTVNSTSNDNRETSNRALFWGIAAAVLVVLAIIYAMTRKDYAKTTPATMAPTTTSTSESSTVRETQTTPLEAGAPAENAPMNRDADTGAAAGSAAGVGTTDGAATDARATGETGGAQGTSAFPATTKSNTVTPIAPGAKDKEKTP